MEGFILKRDLTSSGLEYAAAKNFDDIKQFFGLSRIDVSAPESKLSITGDLSIPTLTDKVLPTGRVPMLLTADTYALRLTNSVGSRYPTEGVHIFRRSSSSSVVSLQADETKSYFFTYSLTIAQ